VTYDGLPARGDDVDLIRHVEPPPTRERESAFRGTCVFPKMACGTAGAVFWAGEDGYVVDIRDYPGYNISELLDGRIPNGMGGFRGPNNPAEQETAIPARVPMSYIARCGHVVAGRRGQLVVDWL
jgi:hypothetical protein